MISVLCVLVIRRYNELLFVLFRDKLPVHVVVDPVLGKVLRPHQREVNLRISHINGACIDEGPL